MCIFESDTVKSDCPVQIFGKMMNYLKIQYRLLVFTLLVLLFFGDIKKKSSKKKKKKALKMTSQLVIFRVFIFFFFVPSTLSLNFFR